ncbi:uncharacterized protein SCDLUD_003368 [Saccharomycodes ludwigii]|uniref:uncharacterized protein n=1 Tax=Saccharomycodes ludwigii TaxID=36035 RepID=UPI001E83A008|nr:hypothetical protein SCDLUD_003368 [Saccharomycodes ludwigii]KAH3900390.1 hypothetical protein SCDLUD_003368 [Saccharomycodes ludwigii]
MKSSQAILQYKTVIGEIVSKELSNLPGSAASLESPLDVFKTPYYKYSKNKNKTTIDDGDVILRRCLSPVNEKVIVVPYLVNELKFLGNNRNYKTCFAILERIHNMSYVWQIDLSKRHKFIQSTKTVSYLSKNRQQLMESMPYEILNEYISIIYSKVCNYSASKTEIHRLSELVLDILNKGRFYQDSNKKMMIPLRIWKKCCNIITRTGSIYFVDRFLQISSSNDPILKDFAAMDLQLTTKQYEPFINMFVEKYSDLEKHELKPYKEIFSKMYLKALLLILNTRGYEMECCKMYGLARKYCAHDLKLDILNKTEKVGFLSLGLLVKDDISRDLIDLKDFQLTFDQYLKAFVTNNIDFTSAITKNYTQDLDFLTMTITLPDGIVEFKEYVDYCFKIIDGRDKLKPLVIHHLLKFSAENYRLSGVLDILTQILKVSHYQLKDLLDVTNFLQNDRDAIFSIFQALARSTSGKITGYLIYKTFDELNLARKFTVEDYYCLIKSCLCGDEHLSSYFYIYELVKNWGHTFLQVDKLDNEVISLNGPC